MRWPSTSSDCTSRYSPSSSPSPMRASPHPLRQSTSRLMSHRRVTRSQRASTSSESSPRSLTASGRSLASTFLQRRVAASRISWHQRDGASRKPFAEPGRETLTSSIRSKTGRSARTFPRRPSISTDWRLSSFTIPTRLTLSRVALSVRRHLARQFVTLSLLSLELFLTQPTLQSELPSKFVIKIKTAFFDTLYYLLDGLVNLVFEYTPLHQEKPSALGGITLPKGQTPTLDVTDLVRCPLTSVVVQD